jgi:hypothetical protein
MGFPCSARHHVAWPTFNFLAAARNPRKAFSRLPRKSLPNSFHRNFTLASNVPLVMNNHVSHDDCGVANHGDVPHHDRRLDYRANYESNNSHVCRSLIDYISNPFPSI